MVKATARVYREHAVALRAIIPVVERFEGRMINKRFTEAMESSELPGTEDYSFSCEEAGSSLIIGLYNHDRSYKETPDNPGGYSGTLYVDNAFMSVPIKGYRDSTEQTPAGNLRVCKSIIMPALEAAAADAEAAAKETEEAWDKRDEMLKAFGEITETLHSFEKKYNYRMRDLNGLCYGLEYRGRSETRDYSVK